MDDKLYTDEKEGIPFLRVQNVSENGLILEDVKFITKEVHNNLLKRSQVLEDNLLITITGRIASSCVAPKGFIGNINQHSVVIKTKKRKISELIASFLNSKIGHKLALRRTSGGSRPALDYTALKSIPIIFEEKIIQIMDNAYKIKKQKEMEAQQLLDSIDEFVLNELGIKLPELKDRMTFDVNSDDIKGKRADAYYHHPKFEEVEKAIEEGKYDVKELNEYIEFTPGFAFPSNYYVKENGIKLLTIKNIKKDGIDFSNVTLLPKDFYDKFSKFQIRQDDILFAMTGATIGKVNIFITKERVLLNQRVGILRVIDNKINNYYLFSFMNTRVFKNKIIRQSCGGAQPNISESEITSIKIPYPPLKIQNKIAEEVKRRMQKAEILQKEAKQLLQEAKEKVEKIIFNYTS